MFNNKHTHRISPKASIEQYLLSNRTLAKQTIWSKPLQSMSWKCSRFDGCLSKAIVNGFSDLLSANLLDSHSGRCARKERDLRYDHHANNERRPHTGSRYTLHRRVISPCTHVEIAPDLLNLPSCAEHKISSFVYSIRLVSECRVAGRDGRTLVSARSLPGGTQLLFARPFEFGSLQSEEEPLWLAAYGPSVAVHVYWKRFEAEI